MIPFFANKDIRKSTTVNIISYHCFIVMVLGSVLIFSCSWNAIKLFTDHKIYSSPNMTIAAIFLVKLIKMHDLNTWLFYWFYRFKKYSHWSLWPRKHRFRHQDHVATTIRSGDINGSKIRGWPFWNMAANGSEVQLFFFFDIKNIICRNILKSLVPHKRICSQRKILFKFYYNFMIIYSNMQITSLNRRDTKMSQAEMDSIRKTALGSVEKCLVVTTIELL